MIRVASRHAALGCALFAAVLLPRWLADEPARGPDLCRSPEALKATSLIPGTTALGTFDQLDERTFQWSEGEVASALTLRPMSFQIVRSYDGAHLVTQATRIGSDALVRARLHPRTPTDEERSKLRLQPEALALRELAVDGATVPVHLAWDHTQPGVSRLVAWTFVFDGEPVARPFAAQLSHAADLALGGPRPLTLVSIAAFAERPRAVQVEEAALAWLADAWRFIHAACAPR
jgi:hypothetical protein